MEGFEMAQKEIIVCIDADLCHDPKYFPLMLEKMKDYDIVIGSRYLTKKKRDGSLLFESLRLKIRSS